MHVAAIAGGIYVLQACLFFLAITALGPLTCCCKKKKDKKKDVKKIGKSGKSVMKNVDEKGGDTKKGKTKGGGKTEEKGDPPAGADGKKKPAEEKTNGEHDHWQLAPTPPEEKNKPKGAKNAAADISLQGELSTNRTQPSTSYQVKDDDDTVKHIESLKEDKERSVMNP